MSILDIIKFLLPFLMSAAEKSFKKLPKEQQQQLIDISKLVEIIKQLKGKSRAEVMSAVVTKTGLSVLAAESYLITYLAQKGIKAQDAQDALNYIWREMGNYTDTGKKGFFNDIVNTLGELIAGIDWKALVLGISEVAYRKYVKDKI